MSLLDTLKKLADQLDNETIDGASLKETVPMVDLEVAAVPRVVEHRRDDWQYNCPETVLYERWDNPPRWAIVKPSDHDFEILPEDDLKRMRARFLLMNGWYYRHFHTLPHSMQCAVMHKFLRHTQGVPPDPNSSFGKMLGIVGGDAAPADARVEGR